MDDILGEGAVVFFARRLSFLGIMHNSGKFLLQILIVTPFTFLQPIPSALVC